MLKFAHYDIYKYSNNRKEIILKKGGRGKPIETYIDYPYD
jgi:mafB-related protein